MIMIRKYLMKRDMLILKNVGENYNFGLLRREHVYINFKFLIENWIRKTFKRFLTSFKRGN